METKLKITIPNPCHEDWNKMTPDETGRFCSSCSKCVVDFTNKSSIEIQEYFSLNQGEKVCGIFKNEQLNKFDLQIPQSVFKQKMPFHKTFLLVLFIVMGTTLFSCKNDEGFPLGEVAVVEDTIPKQRATLGIILPEKDTLNDEDTLIGKVDLKKYDSLVKAGVKMPKLPPQPKVDQVQFKTKGEVIMEQKIDSTKTK